MRDRSATRNSAILSEPQPLPMPSADADDFRMAAEKIASGAGEVVKAHYRKHIRA
jgi:hypothetical protein